MEIKTFETNEVMVAQQKAELDMQITTAKAYPREVEVAIDQSQTMIALSPEIAGGCFYTLTKGGNTITGPSVRLAEIIAANWGNLNVGGRVIEEGQEYVTVQGVAHDMQSNVRYTTDVRRNIVTSKGARYGAAMIQTTIAAALAIAIRNVTFKVIPRAVIDQLDQYARKESIGKKEKISERIEAALLHFRSEYDISPERICIKLGVATAKDIKAKQLEMLIGISTSLRDKSTTIEDEFPPEVMEPKAAK